MQKKKLKKRTVKSDQNTVFGAKKKIEKKNSKKWPGESILPIGAKKKSKKRTVKSSKIVFVNLFWKKELTCHGIKKNRKKALKSDQNFFSGPKKKIEKKNSTKKWPKCF